MRRQGRGTRVGRGAVAAAFATFAALLSHVTAGGSVPGWIGVAVPLALSFVVCTALAGRRLSAWRLAVAVALSQLAFHTLFVLGSYDLAAGGHMHGMTAAAPSTGSLAPTIAPDAAMWFWHAVAAAATTVVLHRAERTVAMLRALAERLVVWLRARVRALVAVFSPEPRRRVVAEVVAEVRPISALLATAVPRRGPPAPAC